MAYSADDLNPTNPYITVDGVDFEFEVMTLRAEAKMREKFGDTYKVYEKIKEEPLRLYDALWILLRNKEFFKQSKKDFIHYFMNNMDTLSFSKQSMTVINDCFLKSAPIIKNISKMQELAKIKAQQDEKPVCYGVYYDKIASRYGHTIDQFFNLTLRQLHILLKVSNDEKYQEIEVQAMLQGRKLKGKMEYVDIDEELDKKAESDAKEMHKKLMEEYNKNKERNQSGK